LLAGARALRRCSLWCIRRGMLRQILVKPLVIGGVERKIHFFAFDLPHSDACFVVGYPAETTEAFCDGHVRAFAFFGGVPKLIPLCTTPRSRWLAFPVMASVNAHACSPGCNRTIYSRICSADLARATTRAKSKGWSAMRAKLPCTHPGVRELRGIEHSLATNAAAVDGLGKQGKREFVQVLRLMEVFRVDEVAAAVRDAIARGAKGSMP
jgi:hypothetical protein